MKIKIIKKELKHSVTFKAPTQGSKVSKKKDLLNFRNKNFEF